VAVTALFAGVFAVRLRSQFHGEYLSENVVHTKSAKSAASAKASEIQTAAIQPANRAVPLQAQSTRGAFPPVVAACLRKEWLVFRGNTAQLIGLLTPLIFIVILNRGLLAMHPTLFLPGAIAYALLGALASLYNVFGADGLGVQVYLLAPVRMRDVIVAKNIASLALIATEAVLAWALVTIIKQAPIPFATEISTAFWTVFVIVINLTLGTWRSIQAPRKYVPGQVRQRRGAIPTNRTSGLLILAVLFGSLLLQIPVGFLSRHFNLPWLGAWIFGPLAVAAVAAYALLLRNAEQLVLSHRDIFAEELCKV
jgi:ABC-2 type transport system permease protein